MGASPPTVISGNPQRRLRVRHWSALAVLAASSDRIAEIRADAIDFAQDVGPVARECRALDGRSISPSMMR